jgi:nucleoside-diphosphate-sugar epimerase
MPEMNKTGASSVEKATAEVDYRPAMALEEGMRRSLKWVWQRQGGLG